MLPKLGNFATSGHHASNQAPCICVDERECVSVQYAARMSNGLSFVGSQRAGSCIWIYKAWYFHRKRKIRQHFRKQLPGKIILESFLCLETVITELVAKAYACKWNHLTNLKN